MLFNILQGAIAISVMGITCFIVPYIKRKLTSEQLAQIKFWVDVVVEAVDQMPAFKNESGSSKKEYVLKFINEKGFKLTKTELDNLIESAVGQLKKVKGAI